MGTTTVLPGARGRFARWISILILTAALLLASAGELLGPYACADHAIAETADPAEPLGLDARHASAFE